MGGPDIHSLSEQHQFIILLLVQVAQLISMVLLWKSSPDKKKNDGSTPASINPGPNNGPPSQ
jgi:hypothetical protein